MKNWLIYILTPILLTSGGEFILKHTINASLYSPKVLVAIACILLGSIFWLYAMSKYQLSFLYPFMSMNFLVITVGSQVFLNEKVSIYRYLAVGLIIIGLIIISKSKNTEAEKK